MSQNVADKIGRGITPRQFIDGMTKNRDAFLDWYNRFEWRDESDRRFFASLKGKKNLRCLILASDWCGDVVRNVPVVLRALEPSEIPVEIFIQEEHMDLMDRFLTMGGRAVPVVIFADEKGDVLARWGPRPKHVQEVMIKFKQENPDRNAPDYEEKIKAAREEMKKRYGEGTDYHAAIVHELREILSVL